MNIKGIVNLSRSISSDRDDGLHDLSDIYGQTPPRTRYNRRQREKKQRSLWGQNNKKSPARECQSKCSLNRRNTLDSFIFNKMCYQADEDEEKEMKEEAAKCDGNRKCKRSLKLTRESERDFKLDVEPSDFYEECEKNYGCIEQNFIKVETRNRFRCLRSKPVDIDDKVKEPVDKPETEDKQIESNFNNLREREVFHDTFSFLIRLGNSDRERNCYRQMSSEESRWQNELKDLIWLELQAYHADRTLVAQDEYLYKQREAIGPLLSEIMSYRFDPLVHSAESSTTSSNDSGFDGSATPNFNPGEFMFNQTGKNLVPECSGCLSMYCKWCSKCQIIALKQIEKLLCRLETAESLYPSSQAFGTHYPLYKNPEFINRVKAMCLWYNMTKHHRLKLKILGKLLMLLDSKNNIEIIENNLKFESILYGNGNCQSLKQKVITDENGDKYTVSFEKSNSAFDNNKFGYLDSYLMEFDRQSYRKYIEEVLKIRGLSRSLNFLERLHTSVLRKAQLTLQKFDEAENNEIDDEDQELTRYGIWSTESKALNLPSYVSTFLFLSRVPLDVVHEFLRMRLEQKPEQPGLLSVRQLMREMREGLKIAYNHRDRFIKHLETALTYCGSAPGYDDIKDFDDSLKAVYEIYLDYLTKWIEMVEYNKCYKNLIEEEWNFVKSIAEKIKDGYSIAGIKFCKINSIIIGQIKEYLLRRYQDNIVNTMETYIEEQSMRMSVAREWQIVFVEVRERICKCLLMSRCLIRDLEKWPANDELTAAIKDLKNEIFKFRNNIVNIISEFQNSVDKIDEPKSEHDRLSFKIRIREILHQAYRMGFDYHKEICKIFSHSERKSLINGLVNFANIWMNFVKTRCERGRGLRPRWANNGLEYLMIVCDPLNTRYLSDQQFEELKANMDSCISHVIGTADISDQQEALKVLSISRAPSPGKLTLSSSKENLKSPESFFIQRKTLSTVDGGNNQIPTSLIITSSNEHNDMKQERILTAIKKLEIEIDEKKQRWELIGRVTDRKSVDTIRIKIRRVTFTWQRGIKIGQGRFGKVYTVVNNQTGELLAMKEVSLQPGDHRAVRRVVEELQIFEGIQHKHLVRYYGIEIHHEEMLIFMEFCAEGTLESFVAASDVGLPEIFVRKYTYQLFLATSVLHSHGIVHRDIKTANIFLTNQANCLKLGDFGSAVQIKAHTTMPGELQGFVGTQAYMAPEVFLENNGHGRAADVWSAACCVIEMASGKRPWAEFDSNYQIMFKVGMGESPVPPKNFCPEGIDLITKALQHNPKQRPTAASFLAHPFVRGYDDSSDTLSTRVSPSLFT